MKFAARLCSHLLCADTIRQIGQCELTLLAIYVERAKLCDDLADCPGASQGERTLLQNLWATILRTVLHHDDDFCAVGIRDQIHGTADACRNL